MIDIKYIEEEFDQFFEFPTADRSMVSSVSARLFAMHIATPALNELARLLSARADAMNEVADAMEQSAKSAPNQQAKCALEWEAARIRDMAKRPAQQQTASTPPSQETPK